MKKLTGRVPPHSLEAERELLGGIMLKGVSALPSGVRADDFYLDGHGEIYAVMLSIPVVDLVAVADKLRQSEPVSRLGGMAYLAGLTDTIPTRQGIESAARVVVSRSRIRQVIAVASEIVARGYIEDNAEELISSAAKQIMDIEAPETKGAFVHISEIVAEANSEIEARANSDQSLFGVSTGFADFDRITGGLKKSDLIIVAARPSMGKTALAMNIAANADCGVGVFSLEMNRNRLAERMISSESGVNSIRLSTGKLLKADWPQVSWAVEHIGKKDIWIDHTTNLHISEAFLRARRLKATKKIGLLIVDYIQFMRGDGGNREQEIASIARGLKNIARELDIPVVALAQLNRACEARPDKRPLLSDLRESGSVEQDADLICFIYRDEVYNKDDNSPNKGVAEIIVRKHRNGPTGTVKLNWSEAITKFQDLAHDPYVERDDYRRWADD